MTKEDLKAWAERAACGADSTCGCSRCDLQRAIVPAAEAVLRLLAQEEARGETPEGDGLDYKANIDKRQKFSQLDLDTVTKPLHAEIERLKESA